MTATRQSLLEWVHTVGGIALDAVFREEAAALAGPKGQHDAARTHHHWGRTARELTFGGRRLSVPCPRVRSTAGREATLPSVAAFRGRDPLTTRVMDQLLLGISSRGYARSLEGAPVGGRVADQQERVSRVAVARTARPAHLARRLGTGSPGPVRRRRGRRGPDGHHRPGRDGRGRRNSWGCVWVDGELAVCTQLLQDLLARPPDRWARAVCDR
jgi:hypothetical protein